MRQICLGLALAVLGSLLCLSSARSITSSLQLDDASVSGAIPAPERELYAGDELELQRNTVPATASLQPSARAANEHSAEAADEASIPIYASPFARADRVPAAAHAQLEHQESSHAPPNYAPRPTSNDLKTSASYGHGHHHGHGYHGGHHGYDHSGWLDMGAWTGGKGSFGWYADYPVGGKHHGYGRK